MKDVPKLPMDADLPAGAVDRSVFLVPLAVGLLILATFLGVLWMNHAARRPVDPVIEHLVKPHPQQPFGGPHEAFDRRPEMHWVRRSPVLRKLHLVRPDLIEYPILVEVYA